MYGYDDGMNGWGWAAMALNTAPLAERYARSEIDQEEYRRSVSTLGGHS